MEFPNLFEWPVISLDTETTGLSYPRHHAFGFSAAWGEPYDVQAQYWDLRRSPAALKWFNDTMKSYNGRVVCHNASFDYLMAKNAGLNIPLHLLDDTVIRACLINEQRPAYDLDALSWSYFGEGKDDPWAELADMFGGLPTRNGQAKNLHRAPPSLVARYCNKDAELTLRLWYEQEEEIQATENDCSIPLQKIVDFERRIMPTFIRAQERGVRVDVVYAEEAMTKMTPIIDEMQTQLNTIAGFAVNVNSGPQVKKVFDPQWKKGRWVASDGTVLPTTKKGGASIDAATLRVMKHAAAPLIQEVRSLIKTRDTFLGQHIIQHSVAGRVYPNINQNKGEDGGTGTGRLSYTNPALQQIPSRNPEAAAIVKRAFLADEGQIWCETDMDTFEVRVFISLANVKKMITAYKEDPTIDGHQYVADLTGLPRNPTHRGGPNSKQLNLSMIFNQGNGAIAEAMNLPWEWDSFINDEGVKVTYKRAGFRAMEAIDAYHLNMPGVKSLATRCKNTAEERGFVRTDMGRRLRFPNKWKSYKASGLLIQATSADINKENWEIIEEELGDQGHMILNTHDSYGMSLNEDTWAESFKRVRARIEGERIKVPLRLGLNGTGNNWWDAINDKLKANEGNLR